MLAENQGLPHLKMILGFSGDKKSNTFFKLNFKKI